MKFIQCEQGSEAWFQARAGVITASTFRDITSTVGGLTAQQQKYVDAIKAGKTEIEAWMDAGYKAKPVAENIKRALAGQQVAEPSDIAMRLCTDHAIELISGKPYGEPPNAWTLKRGHELEPHARMAYEQMTGNLALEAGLCLTDDGAFGYSTDGMVKPIHLEGNLELLTGCEGLIEVKCPVDSLKIMAIWRTGDLSEYMDQMQGGMWLTGAKWCDFIMYVPDLANAGKDLYVKRVHRDDEFITRREKDLLAARQRVLQIENFLRTPAGNPTRQTTPPAVAPAPAASAQAPVDVHPFPSTPVVTQKPAAATDNEKPTLRLGEICERLGFTATVERNAKLYKESYWPAICEALIQHLTQVADLQPA